MSATTLPGLTPGRQPYPGGAERHVPIVPHVLIVGERKGYYLPPPIARAETVYDTPTTVRVRLPQGRQETQQQHKVWAVPDDAAWAEIEAAVALFERRLGELANVLRELGRYRDHLAAKGGMSKAPNPLCESVARIDDPDTTGTNWWLTPWHVPRLDRQPIERHTPKMLATRGGGGYVVQQQGSFVLGDDAAWKRVEAAHKQAAQAAQDAQALLERLGTYQDALDGRHAARVAPAERAVGSPAPSSAAAVREHLGHALGWTGNGTPTYHLEQARAELEQVRAEAPGMALELEREVAAAAAQVAAREAGEKALAVIVPAVDGIVVMTVEEARQAADRIVAAVDNLRQLIDEFDQGQGWRALGYDSFRAWAAAEIPDTSLRHVYRLRDAAEVDRSLGLPVGATPESHARELKGVAPEQRAEVLERADERAQGAGRERTAADVRVAAAAGLPDGWDEARERARAIGARLWHNESDGTYTLSERAGHVPRTSSWQELLMWLSQAEGRAAAVTIGHTPAPVAGVDDAPLTDAELADLSRLGGWELDLSRPARPGKVALRLCRGERWDTVEARSPDGWRYELAQLRQTEAARRAPPLPALPDGWRWRERGDGMAQAQQEAGPSLTACYRPGQEAEAAAEAFRLAGQGAPLPPDYTEWADRAQAARCGLSRDAAGRYVLITPSGLRETRDAWIATIARVREFEVRTPAPAPAEAEEPDAVPVDQRDSYTAAERALAEELAACSPRLRRLLLLALTSPDDTPPDEGGDALFDLLTEGLLMTVDEALEWALAAPGAASGPAPAAEPAPPAVDRWPHIDHPALEELSAELMGAELMGGPPDGDTLARWQDTLDAHAADVSDETYERLAHRIGELRQRGRVA